MILVDSTVWIDYFNGRITPETTAFDNLLGTEKVIMGDIILAEVLQGFRSDQDFETARQALMPFIQVSMLKSRPGSPVRQEIPAAQKSRHYGPQDSGLFYCYVLHRKQY